MLLLERCGPFVDVVCLLFVIVRRCPWLLYAVAVCLPMLAVGGLLFPIACYLSWFVGVRRC